MACPHEQFRARSRRFGAYTTVLSCQSSAKTCPECDLLLRVVEEYKPGWLNAGHVDSRRKRALYLDDRHGSSGVIQLKEDRTQNFREESWDWFENLHLVGSFSVFRKAKGRSPARFQVRYNVLTGTQKTFYYASSPEL
jgi:hypothetical protein